MSIQTSAPGYVAPMHWHPYVELLFIIEGEEETGSNHLYEFVKRYNQKLAADVMVLTDAGNWDTGVPALTTALRGIVVLHIEPLARPHIWQPFHLERPDTDGTQPVAS